MCSARQSRATPSMGPHRSACGSSAGGAMGRLPTDQLRRGRSQLPPRAAAYTPRRNSAPSWCCGADAQESRSPSRRAMIGRGSTGSSRRDPEASATHRNSCAAGAAHVNASAPRSTILPAQRRRLRGVAAPLGRGAARLCACAHRTAAARTATTTSRTGCCSSALARSATIRPSSIKFVDGEKEREERVRERWCCDVAAALGSGACSTRTHPLAL